MMRRRPHRWPFVPRSRIAAPPARASSKFVTFAHASSSTAPKVTSTIAERAAACCRRERVIEHRRAREDDLERLDAELAQVLAVERGPFRRRLLARDAGPQARREPEQQRCRVVEERAGPSVARAAAARTAPTRRAEFADAVKPSSATPMIVNGMPSTSTVRQ
jgi:hypothetical protein